MSCFTIAELDEQITAYKAALKAVSINQEYTVGGRRFSRADLPEIRKTLEWLGTERSRMAHGMTPGMQGVSTRVAR
ncbi:hypothetical protein HNR65_002156 [Desulfosalsimonas propionicica]|uniref:GpW protein n=1 Tax=Desulfosalsimonas propionicica TaxID=332175 RepID=A0A7W0HL30_9BACT|nr:hypothetical protein [Desulfosalsimonas propionicica]MBA2881825.1 hypothetical protein [Desulfosalsimonas propionicica]